MTLRTAHRETPAAALACTASPHRILLAVNERARHGRNVRAHIASVLVERGYDVVPVEVDGKPHALSDKIIALRDSIDAVALAGGDGTLVAALRGLVVTKLPLLIFPCGTINDFARAVGVPFELKRAAAALDDGIPAAVDVGCVNGVYYLNAASIRRPLLMIPVLLKAFGITRAMQLWVEDEHGNGRLLRTVQLSVANSYHYCRIFDNHADSLKDGRLWLYATVVRNAFDAVNLLMSLLMGRFPHCSQIVTMSGARFAIRSADRRRFRITADGEPAGQLPAEFRSVHSAITVMVPAGSASGMFR